MANVNVRIDDDIKKEAEEILKQIGITPSAAINMFYIQIIRTASIPFELKADIPNKETLEALKEVEEMEKHRESHKSYSSAKEIIDEVKEEMKKGDL